MMTGVDSFELALNQIARDLSDINDGLALIGILYVGKVVANSIVKSINGIRSYLIPSIISNEKWLKSLGNWAIVTGKHNSIDKRFFLRQVYA